MSRGCPAGCGCGAAISTEQRNLVFMGTNVVSGTATALVVATVGRSYLGTLAAHATATETAPNAFQAGVNSVSWLLIRFAAVMLPIIFFVNGFTKSDWLEAFLVALSVAVGLTPEMLPMIVTSTLAKGAVRLSRRTVSARCRPCRWTRRCWRARRPHMLRTPRLPFVQSRAAWPLMGMTLAIMAVGLWLPLGPLAGYFKLQALPAAYYGGLVAILLGCGLLSTGMKRVYIRRYGWQ